MQLKLAAKQQRSTDIVSFSWEAPQPVVWRAGQYGVFYLPHQSDQNGPERFFTIDTPPFTQQLRFTTRISNTSYKQALHSLPIGGEILLQSIGGEFVIQDDGQQYVFIAFGMGITPFRSILLELAHSQLPLNVNLFYQHVDKEFLFEEDFELACQTLNLGIKHFQTPQPLVDHLIGQLLNYQEAKFYIAGPIPLVERTEELLLQNGIQHNHIYGDYFEYDWSQIIG